MISGFGFALLEFASDFKPISYSFSYKNLSRLQKEQMVRVYLGACLESSPDIVYECVPGFSEYAELIESFFDDPANYLDLLYRSRFDRGLGMIDYQNLYLTSESTLLAGVSPDRINHLLVFDRWECYRLIINAIIDYCEPVLERLTNDAIPTFVKHIKQTEDF